MRPAKALDKGSRRGRAEQRNGEAPPQGRDTEGKRVGGSHPRGNAGPKRAGEARVLRIIGGTWRGRKLRFPPSPEIRPTPDRVRETLFNWLAQRLPGARCLDLFAGSGALGLESLSRGAAHVTFVERDAAAARELRARLVEWGASGGEVLQTDAMRFLGNARRGANAGGSNASGGLGGGLGGGSGSGGGGVSDGNAGGGFDIVFLDPPFDSDLLTLAAERLDSGDWLAPNALIYVECAARNGLPPLPATWATTKTKQAGEVGYHLLTRA